MTCNKEADIQTRAELESPVGGGGLGGCTPIGEHTPIPGRTMGTVESKGLRRRPRGVIFMSFYISPWIIITLYIG